MRRGRIISRSLAVSAARAAAAAVSATGLADTSTWTGGGGNNNWSTGANWAGANAPVSADATEAIFGDASLRSAPNQDAASFTVNKITFPSDATGAFGLTGNAIIFDGADAALTQNSTTYTMSVANVARPVGELAPAGSGYTVVAGGNLSHVFGATTVNNSATLNVAQPTTNAPGFGNVRLGALNFAAGKTLKKQGPGILYLDAAAGTIGAGATLQIGEATVSLYAANALGAGGQLNVTVNGGAVLNDNDKSGPIGKLVVNGGMVNNIGYGANLTVGGVEMTGGQINLTGASGGTLLTLAGDFTTRATASTAWVYQQYDGPELNLNGATRTFNVEDGAAADDLRLSCRIRGGPGSNLIKTGAGRMVLDYANIAWNDYVGFTQVDGGTLVLASRHEAAVAIPGDLTINAGTVTYDATANVNKIAEGAA